MSKTKKVREWVWRAGRVIPVRSVAMGGRLDFFHNQEGKALKDFFYQGSVMM